MGWSSDLKGEPRSLKLCLWSRVRHVDLVSVLREGCSESHRSADPTMLWRQTEFIYCRMADSASKCLPRDHPGSPCFGSSFPEETPRWFQFPWSN